MRHGLRVSLYCGEYQYQGDLVHACARCAAPLDGNFGFSFGKMTGNELQHQTAEDI